MQFFSRLIEAAAEVASIFAHPRARVCPECGGLLLRARSARERPSCSCDHHLPATLAHSLVSFFDTRAYATLRASPAVSSLISACHQGFIYTRARNPAILQNIQFRTVALMQLPSLIVSSHGRSAIPLRSLALHTLVFWEMFMIIREICETLEFFSEKLRLIAKRVSVDTAEHEVIHGRF